MKKIISLALVITMCVSMLFIATSCFSKHPIEQLKEDMDGKNYQMVVTMTGVPFFGTFTATEKVDGDIECTKAMGETTYTETVSETIKYEYTENEDGTWSKEVKKEETSDDETLFDVLLPENFEKVKGEENKYRQKADVEFDEYQDVEITIEEGSYTLEMVSEDGYATTIVISKIGEIELTLPQVNN